MQPIGTAVSFKWFSG